MDFIFLCCCRWVAVVVVAVFLSFFSNRLNRSFWKKKNKKFLSFFFSFLPLCVGCCSYICTMREAIFHHAYNACCFSFFFCSSLIFIYSMSWESFNWSHSNRSHCLLLLKIYIYSIYIFNAPEHISMFRSVIVIIPTKSLLFFICEFRFKISITFSLLHWHLHIRLPNIQCSCGSCPLWKWVLCKRKSYSDDELPERLACCTLHTHGWCSICLNVIVISNNYDRGRSLESTCFLGMIFLNLKKKTIFLRTWLHRCAQHSVITTWNPNTPKQKNKIQTENRINKFCIDAMQL